MSDDSRTVGDVLDEQTRNDQSRWWGAMAALELLDIEPDELLGEIRRRLKVSGRSEELLAQWQTWYHEHQVWLSEVDPEGADRRISLDAATIKYFRGEHE